MLTVVLPHFLALILYRSIGLEMQQGTVHRGYPQSGYFRDIPDEFKIKSLYSNDLILNIASKSKGTAQKLKFLDSPYVIVSKRLEAIIGLLLELRMGGQQGIYTLASAVLPLQQPYQAAFVHVPDLHSLMT